MPQTARARRRHLALRAAFVFLLIAVTVLSVIPNPTSAIPGNALTRFLAERLLGDMENADKVGHFIAYFTLGGVAFAAAIARRPIWAAPALLALYGGLLEGVQYFIDARSADLLDIAANGLGAAAGICVAGALAAVAGGSGLFAGAAGGTPRAGVEASSLCKGEDGVGGRGECGADDHGDRQH